MAIDKIKVTELKKLAKKGDVKAMVELAKTYDSFSSKYLKWTMKAATLGDYGAQDSMAIYYKFKASLPNQTRVQCIANLQSAKSWFRKMIENPEAPRGDKARINKEVKEIEELLDL